MRAGEDEKLRAAGERLLVGLAKHTVAQRRASLGRWLDFCRRAGLKTWRDCDVAVATGWIGRLQGMGVAPQTVRQTATFPFRCVELLQQLEPESVNPKFAVPYAQLPVIRRGYRGPVMTERRLADLVALCVREIEGSAGALDRAGLVPFLILFCIGTGMNVDGALGLRRGCLVRNDDGHWLYWRKDRSKGSMRAHHGPLRWGPVEIVQALLARHQNDFVFSIPGANRPLPESAGLVRRWCRERGVPEFTLSEIRPAMATLIYQLSDGDALEVKEFLGHTNLATTLAYISENIARPINERLLAEAQDRMADRIGVPKDPP